MLGRTRWSKITILHDLRYRPYNSVRTNVLHCDYCESFVAISLYTNIENLLITCFSQRFNFRGFRGQDPSLFGVQYGPLTIGCCQVKKVCHQNVAVLIY